jgi:hypothetical protein
MINCIMIAYSKENNKKCFKKLKIKENKKIAHFSQK